MSQKLILTKTFKIMWVYREVCFCVKLILLLNYIYLYQYRLHSGMIVRSVVLSRTFLSWNLGWIFSVYIFLYILECSPHVQPCVCVCAHVVCPMFLCDVAYCCLFMAYSASRPMTAGDKNKTLISAKAEHLMSNS